MSLASPVMPDTLICNLNHRLLFAVLIRNARSIAITNISLYPKPGPSGDGSTYPG